MRTNSADPVFARPMPPHASASASKRAQQERMPSTTGYMLVAGIAAGGLFIGLWWMLHSGGDDTPWVPAALAAGVVMFVAAAAREVVMRRAWTRYVLEHDRRDHHATNETWKRTSGNPIGPVGGGGGRVSRLSAALRALQKQAAEADAAGAQQPEAHLEVYQACKEFLASAEEAMRAGGMDTEKSVALRSGQERARALQKHHLLAWARGSSRIITGEAQRRVLHSGKIETAMRALEVIESARRIYPDDVSLLESEAAVQEYIVSVKIGRWIELAERSAFKGQYRRAIDRYRDALFYLSRETMNEESRAEVAERVGREIELLRARLKTSNLAAKTNTPASHKKPPSPNLEHEGKSNDQPAMSEM